MRTRFINFINALTGSYGQVFFSDNKIFALFLFAASFTDPATGVSGLSAVIFSILLAGLVDLNPYYVKNGTYSFNSLLTGLALGAYFKLSGNFLVITLLASSLSLLLTVWLSAITSRFKLPFLSLPFILTVWIIFLNARSFDAGFLQLRHGGDECFLFNASAAFGQQSIFGSHLLQMYFKTMAAVFFQGQVVAGVLIVTGLVIYSRIAFVLSLAGFLSGYLYFQFVQGQMSDLKFQLVASSYILSALGLGGFFLISSTKSFLLVVVSAPIIGLLTHSTDKILFLLGLPVYSLPFSLAVIIILSMIYNLYSKEIFHVVQVQQYSPEKNLYAWHTFMERFKKETETIIHLPFFGEWTVSQGHDGALTHQKDWRFAWDFVVKDEHKRTFQLPGKNLSDFYCYGLPVLSPADGQVITIEDGIGDNEIGNVNLAQNWGNTVVVKHTDQLYSKISHLKKGSFKIKEGDSVKKGEILALCGNSGRSPEPHIHFQLQASEKVGAPTVNYPISYYARKVYDVYQFHFFDIPAEDDTLVKPIATPLLKKAFNFIPGTRFNFQVADGTNNYNENWEVLADAYNNSYISCKRTKAAAYFKFDDTLFYFTGFKGDTNNLLYYFYLGAYKIILSQFQNLKVSDRLSIEGTYKGAVKILQDVVAPFYIFLKPGYTSVVNDSESGHPGTAIKISSKARSNFMGRNADFEITITGNKIQEIKITEKDKCITAKNIQ